jgi:hypothetical protein
VLKRVQPLTGLGQLSRFEVVVPMATARFLAHDVLRAPRPLPSPIAVTL